MVRAVRRDRYQRPVVGVVGSLDAALRDTLKRSFELRGDMPAAAIATLRHDDGLTLLDGEDILARWSAAEPDIAAQLLDWLYRLDACHALMRCGGPAGPAFTVEVSVGSADPSLPATDATVGPRVCVYNPDPRRSLHFAVYRLAADRRIHVLTRRTAQGLCALPLQHGEPVDVALSGPGGLEPAHGVRGEKIVVLGSHEPLLAAHVLAHLDGKHERRTRGPTREAAVRVVVHPLRPPDA